MLRLTLDTSPKELDLGGDVKVTVLPLSSALFRTAKADPAIIEANQNESGKEVITAALVKAIARLTIQSWDGIGDADGNPVDPSPDYINALMDRHAQYEAFINKFVGPYMVVRDEGNDSAP